MEIKQPGSFLLGLEVEVDGEIQDLTGWTVSAAVASKNRAFYRQLTVTVLDAAKGLFELSGPTADWPTGQLLFDIKYVTDSEQIIMTESVEVLVTQGITK